MDAIEALDHGANAHFTFQAREFPGILDVMQPAYHICSYVGICVLAALIVLILVFQRKHFAAVIVVAGLLAAIGLIEGIRLVVPRERPQDAVKMLGAAARVGSYPAAGVFLFMLMMIFLVYAIWGLSSTIWLRCLVVGLATLLTVWVCMSQFFLGLHFVSDVIGGIAGATLFGWIACRLIQSASYRAIPSP